MDTRNTNETEYKELLELFDFNLENEEEQEPVSLNSIDLI